MDHKLFQIKKNNNNYILKIYIFVSNNKVNIPNKPTGNCINEIYNIR